jgi:hypothetical protein
MTPAHCRRAPGQRHPAPHPPRHGARCVRTAPPPNAAPQNHQTTTRSRDHPPESVHIVMIYGWNTDRRRQCLKRCLRRSPALARRADLVGPPSRWPRSEGQSTRRTPGTFRAPHSWGASAVQHGVPFLRVPSAHVISSDQTDRTALPSFRQHKTISSYGFVFWPPPRRGGGEDANGARKRSVDVS